MEEGGDGGKTALSVLETLYKGKNKRVGRPRVSVSLVNCKEVSHKFS